MTLAWSHSANGNLALLVNISDPLKVKLGEVYQQSYGELYEPVTDEASCLQDSLEEILELFQDENQSLGHLRYVWMALILAIVVEPTIQYYQPNNSTVDETIVKMAIWLLEAIKVLTSSEMPSVKIINFDKLDIELSISSTLSKKLESFQVLYDAWDVYINAVKTLDKNQSLEALINILDDCLEGYAIFPGSYGRRDLLNWWLLDVVPSSWFLLPPSSVYVVDNLQDTEIIRSHQVKILDDISSVMWSVILEAQKKNQRLHSPNKTALNVKVYNYSAFSRKLSIYEDSKEVNDSL